MSASFQIHHVEPRTRLLPLMRFKSLFSCYLRTPRWWRAKCGARCMHLSFTGTAPGQRGWEISSSSSRKSLSHQHCGTPVQNGLWQFVWPEALAPGNVPHAHDTLCVSTSWALFNRMSGGCLSFSVVMFLKHNWLSEGNITIKERG